MMNSLEGLYENEIKKSADEIVSIVNCGGVKLMRKYTLPIILLILYSLLSVPYMLIYWGLICSDKLVKDT